MARSQISILTASLTISRILPGLGVHMSESYIGDITHVIEQKARKIRGNLELVVSVQSCFWKLSHPQRSGMTCKLRISYQVLTIRQQQYKVFNESFNQGCFLSFCLSLGVFAG
jgi:hypothetical protein